MHMAVDFWNWERKGDAGKRKNIYKYIIYFLGYGEGGWEGSCLGMHIELKNFKI